MKNFFFVFVVVVLFSSCTKDEPQCYISYTTIKGFYRITKVVENGSDISSAFLTPCRQNADFQLYYDKDLVDQYAIYQEYTCSGGGGGTWTIDLTNKKISITTAANPGDFMPITDAAITSWDCTNLVITSNYLGKDYVITLTKYKSI